MSPIPRVAFFTGLLSVGACASLLLLLLAAGCGGPKASVPTPRTSSPPAEEAVYVGNAACAECHRAEFDPHHASRHALTLRRADRQSLGPLAPPTGPIPNTPYEIAAADGALHFVRNDPNEGRAPIQYAFGSGKTVMTYVGEIGANRLTEFAMSYSPGSKVWYITPGQERLTGVKLGDVNELGRARRCMLCHAVKVQPTSAEPPPGFEGVGCESCHGPGGAHIAAVRTPNATDIKMERIRSWGASRINALCARCHRSVDDLSPGALEANSTARFQPYGLEMSPCFKKSGDRLSCLTCHNPHTNVSTDTRAYERACLSCHSATASPPGKVCPVNARTKCIGCHMPREQVFAGANIPISMPDHMIWAYRPHR